MIRSTVFLVIALLLLCSCVLASGFQNSGIGIKARGMGGAFRAVADNWTAAYYNPAGYAFLVDNQLGFSQGFSNPRHELTPDYYLGDDYDIGVFNEKLYNHHEILSMPAGGFAVRLPLFGEIVWGLSGFQPFDYNLTWTIWEPDIAFNDSVGSNIPIDQIETDIDIIAFQMTTARTFSNDRLAIGIGLQLLRADISISDFIVRPNPEWNDRPKNNVFEFANQRGGTWGFGLNIGLLYKVNEKLNFALTGTLPVEFDIEGTSTQRYVFPSANANDTSLFIGGKGKANADNIVTSDFSTTLKIPGVFGIGLAYQVNDKLTLALDAEYTLWSSYDGMTFEYSNYDLSNMGNDTTNFAFFRQDVTNPADWENTGKIAIGAHYIANNVFSFMGGISAEQSPQRSSILITPHFLQTGDRYGFSGGTQLSFERWEIGIMATVFDYQTDQNISLQYDIDSNGVPDSFPGYYKAAAVETLLSVNYHF